MESSTGWCAKCARRTASFYASLDADSEGEEGRFYVWQADEVRALLNADEWAVVAPHFGLDRGANFEGHAWHLRVTVPLDEVAARMSVAPGEAARWRTSARAKLAAARARRVRPSRDDKILTSWNALAIAGLARAGRVLAEPSWAELAFAAADALKAGVWRDGRLYATRGEGVAALNAYLDDHAFLLAALLEMMQTRFRRADFDWACALADVLLARFEDNERGGFWFTATTTRRCSTATSRATTTRHPPATASPRMRSSRSAISPASRATSRRRNARCGCSRLRSPPRRAAIRRW